MAEVIQVLVGGPVDGRRVSIPDRSRVFYVPRINRIDLNIKEHYLDGAPMEFKSQFDEYHRVDDRVYVHESISDKDLVSLLVSGYRNEIER